MAKYADAKVEGIERVMRAFRALAKDTEKAAEKMLDNVALFYARQIKDGIRKQAPGGKRFKPLADSTVARKGSSKALVDHGDLKAGITWTRPGKGMRFIGLLRTRQHPSGQTAANLGEIHEYGSKKRPGRPPARPFIRPIRDSLRIKMKASDLMIDKFEYYFRRRNVRHRWKLAKRRRR